MEAIDINELVDKLKDASNAAIDNVVFNAAYTPDRDQMVPVRHGYWSISEYEYFDCSVCGASYPSGCESTKEAKEILKNGGYYPYCPYCGAKMDAKEGNYENAAD